MASVMILVGQKQFLQKEIRLLDGVELSKIWRTKAREDPPKPNMHDAILGDAHTH